MTDYEQDALDSIKKADTVFDIVNALHRYGALNDERTDTDCANLADLFSAGYTVFFQDFKATPKRINK